jgi:hypothetical protein
MKFGISAHTLSLLIISGFYNKKKPVAEITRFA